MVHIFLQRARTLWAEKHNRQKLLEAAAKYEIAKSYSRVCEVVLESTFQPILQWFLIFPAIIANLRKHMTDNHGIDHSCPETLKKNQEQADLLYVSMVQFLSWLTSLCSVAWSFSDYSRAMKRGALSPSVSLVSRALILLSYISFIFVRINIFVFFIYILGSGPQQFYLGVAGIGVHAVLMGFLHLATSNIRKQKGESTCCSRMAQILRSFLVNGLANIFFHNYVDHRCIVQKTHTFKRQFLFEVVLLLENIAVSVASCFFIPFKPFNDYTERNILFLVLSCIYIFAIVCKLVYYKFFHIWKDVNAKFDRKNNVV